MQNENGFITSQEDNLKELARYNKHKNENDAAFRTAIGNWEELGPHSWEASSGWNPGVGRITSVAVEEGNSNHIIVGAPSGGIWKTTDKGETWTSITENRSNLSVYALAIDPNNPDVYYWGSNSGNIYKSVNGGASWQTLARVSYFSVIKIKIHPTNSNIIYIGNRFENIHMSTNGGANWTALPFNNGGYDIEFHPTNSNIVYASGNGFFKSTDGGANFSEVSGFGNGAKMIAVSPDSEDIVYVLEETQGSFSGLYKSTDKGENFTKLSHTQNFFGYSTNGTDNRGQAPRDMAIAVSATNADEVHIAGINTWRSLDGGVTFHPSSDWTPGGAHGKGIGYCHADVDIMEYVNGELFLGTDGGIFVAEDPTNLTTNFYKDLSTNIGIRQFYKIGVSQTNSVIVTGGSQDNGTSVFFDDENKWYDWLGGDGMETFVDKNDNTILYGTTQNGGLWKSDSQGKGYRYINLGSPEGKDGEWVTPFEQDPTEANTLYAGYDQVYKSTDGGNNWTAISQNFGSNMNHLKIAPSNNKVIYTAFGANLFKTEDGGNTNWTLVTNEFDNINDIAIHPNDANKIALAVRRYQRVVVSEDGGNTWTSYKYDLPNFTTLSLAWQTTGTQGLYVGTNYGIYFLEENTTSWTDYRGNLPFVSVNELEINTADQHLYAATYGRGLWRTPIIGNTLSTNNFNLKAHINVFPNPVKSELNIRWNQLNNTELIIYNIQGQTVYYTKENESSISKTINVNHLTNGIYFLKINANNQSYTQKFIKE